MRIVIRIAGTMIRNADHAMKCAQSVAGLLEDGHHIVLLHGCRTDTADANGNELEKWVPAHKWAVGAGPIDMARLVSIQSDNLYLAGSLARFGVSALGLCGSDAGICRVRKSFTHGDGYTLETARIDPRWLHIICNNGGVPVISNLVTAGLGEYYLIECDQMAAVCASDWRADVLIYLTDGDGVRGAHGSVMRWLDLNDIDVMERQNLITGDMLLKLKRCREALMHGVGRVRILPANKSGCLQLFFRLRIEFGTELFIR